MSRQDGQGHLQEGLGEIIRLVATLVHVDETLFGEG